MANFHDLKLKDPDWPEEQLLKGAVAAYNVGVSNIKTIDGMDVGTTHDDYSADVLARAQYFAGIK